MAREAPQARLKRLRARKDKLHDRLKSLRENNVRNADHKRDLINTELTLVTAKIMELEEHHV